MGMCSWDLKFQDFKRLGNEEQPAFRVELKIFTRFVFKLVSRVSRSVPLDIPATSKRTDVHNLYVIFKFVCKCLLICR